MRRSRVRAEVIPMPALSAINPGNLSEILEPRRHLIECSITGQIDVQRGDRYALLADGVEIGSRPGIGLRAGRTDPVDRLAVRIAGAHRRLGLVAVPQAGGLITG